MSRVDATEAVKAAIQTTIDSDQLFGALPCGHSRAATVFLVDVGERKEGEAAWTILRREIEVECADCYAKARFNVARA